MVWERIEQLFEGNGYSKVSSNVPAFAFYYREEYQAVTVLYVIDYREIPFLSAEQYGYLKKGVEEYMHANGKRDVHLLTLALSDDTQKARQLCGYDRFCWVIDTTANRLIIYEEQVSDFYGWKGILEEFLLRPDAAPGEQKVYGSDTKRAGERSGLRNLPWVNICLVIVNVIVFLICTFTGDLLYNKGASGVLYLIEDKAYYRMLTSMFLHSDTRHLFNNMLLLFFMGEIVEKKLGHFRYAILYFLSGIAGDVVSMGYELVSGDFYSSVGASGAVFGVQGALLLLVILYRGGRGVLPVRRVALMTLFSLYCGFMSTNVNNAAHVGGVLMGFALAAVFCLIGKQDSGKDGE